MSITSRCTGEYRRGCAGRWCARPRRLTALAAWRPIPTPLAPPTRRYDYETTLGLEQLDELYALSPSRLLLNTEACVLEELVDGWGMAWLYAADVLGGLNHHLSAWLAWNAVLLTGDKFPYWKGAC